MPSEILNVLSYSCEAKLIVEMICDLMADVELNLAVYVQSVAMPIKATFLVVGQPAVDPFVEARFTPAPFPPVVPSICRPKSDLGFIDQNPFSASASLSSNPRYTG